MLTGGSEAMVIDRVAFAVAGVGSESATCTVKLKTPLTCGVPLIVPFEPS